jgi:hypothetical protein
MDKVYIIVDGSNIAFYKRTHNKKAKYNNLAIVKDFLKDLSKKFPICWETIIDASLRHRIDDKDSLEKDIKKGLIAQCPDKIEADKFILEFFSRHPENTLIISNDNFKEYKIDNLVIFKFVILFDEIIIEPNIEEFLDTHEQASKEVKLNA